LSSTTSAVVVPTEGLGNTLSCTRWFSFGCVALYSWIISALSAEQMRSLVQGMLLDLLTLYFPGL